MRLFVAIELPAAVRAHLATLCAGLHGAQWVAPENLHITLSFLGDLGGGLAEEVAEAFGEIRAKRFDLSLAGIGEFSSPRSVRAVWVGVEANERLSALQAKVDHTARRLGVETERRKFHPHVTLARFRSGTPNLGRYIQEHEPFRLDPFPVEEFVLFSSQLGSEQPVYTAEVRYALGSA